jgi:hypothetical protein
VDAPTAVVGHAEERVSGGTPASAALVVHGALLDPFRDRRTLVVAWEVLLDTLDIELELSGRSGKRVLLGIVVERPQADDIVFPTLSGLEDNVLILLELVPLNEFVQIHVVEHFLLKVLDALAFGELLLLAEGLGDLENGLVVALRLANRLDGFVQEDDTVLLRALAVLVTMSSTSMLVLVGRMTSA